MTYNFNDYKNDALTKPRDLAWAKPWAKFEKVGDKVQGFIADVFYRPAQGIYKEQRGITLKQEDGTFINMTTKRLPFILEKTDHLRLGDPLVAELTELQANDKGNPTKIVSYYGKNLDANKDNKTVKELEAADLAMGGSTAPAEKVEADEVPFP